MHLQVNFGSNLAYEHWTFFLLGLWRKIGRMGFIFLRYILKHCSLWIGNYSISTMNLEQNGNTVRNSCHWKFLRDQFEMLYSYETELSGDVKQQIFPPVRNRNCIAYHAFVFTFSNSFGDLKGVWCPRFLSKKRKTIFHFFITRVYT